MVCAGFKNELEGYDTGNLDRVVAAMNAKTFLAGEGAFEKGEDGV